MDISNLRTTLDPSTLGAAAPASAQAGGNLPPIPSQAAGASGSTSVQSGQASQPGNVTPSTLEKAVQKINQQLEQSSGVTLSAGLDTSGSHPGQVLVELSDKATQQTFFKYYVPAQQVVQASENLGSGGAPGALISAKA